MLFLVFILCNTLWFSILIDAKPEDLFSLASDNELIEPVSDNDFISFPSLNNPSSNDISPSDLAYLPATSISEYDVDSHNLAVSDLFPDEDHSVNASPFLQSPSDCENENLHSWVDDGISSLQVRDDASCTPSKPKENDDSIMNLFQDPWNFLLQNIPKTKAPAGQSNQPGQDDDNFTLDTLFNNRPAPLLFEEDGKKCPIAEFGLSITPVCLDSLKGSAIGSPGTGFTLHDVEPCESRFHNTAVPEVRVRHDIDAAIDDPNDPCSVGAELWCCREITSEVNLASFILTLGFDKYLI